MRVNPCMTNDPCAICGERCDPIGVDVFVAGTWALVCDLCAEEHSPGIGAGRHTLLQKVRVRALAQAVDAMARLAEARRECYAELRRCDWEAKEVLDRHPVRGDPDRKRREAMEGALSSALADLLIEARSECKAVREALKQDYGPRRVFVEDRLGQLTRCNPEHPADREWLLSFAWAPGGVTEPFARDAAPPVFGAPIW